MKQVMKSALYLTAFAVYTGVLASPASARTVMVTSCNRETGATVLAISAAEAGDGAKALVAAWSSFDIGEDIANANETLYIGAVAATETEKLFTIPAQWREKAGFVRFYLMAALPPYDARLASLRSETAGPYIETGFVPISGSDIRVKAYYPGEAAPFGVAGKCNFFTNMGSANERVEYFTAFFGETSSTISAPRGTKPHEYWLNNTGAHVDGVCYVAYDPSKVTGSTTSTMTLFARKNENGGVSKQGDCTIYWAQIRNNGTLVHDYIPCLKDGVATLYDRVTRTTSTVSGSGSFTAGDEIGPDATDCGGVESVSAALVFGPALAVESISYGTAEVTVSIDGTHDEGVLYAVADTADQGMTASDWANVAFVGKVAAEASSVTATLPGDWFANSYQVRFIWRSAEDFPYDREVEWLSSSGFAWADSDVIPTEKTKICVCGKSAVDVALFGLNGYFYILPHTVYYYGLFGISNSFAVDDSILPTDFHTFALGPSGVEIDGVQKVDFVGMQTSYTKMTKGCSIFFRRNGDAVEKNGTAWIKSAKFWEEGRLIRDFTPCVLNGVACFYDRVYGNFVKSKNASAFEAGETVSAIADEEAVAWSCVVGLATAGATWDNGGADNSFATSANWDGDIAPDIESGSTMLMFATAGAAAEVPAYGAAVNGIRFDTAGDFALTAASDGDLSIGGGGITLADRGVSGTWRMHDLDLPVTLTADQTWSLSGIAGQRLRVLGNVQGTAGRTLTVTGAGCLSLSATNDFAGNVVLNGGMTKVFSKLRPFGSAAEGGEVVIDQSKGGAIEFYGAVVDKPIRIIGDESATSDKFLTGGLEETTFAAPIYQSGDLFRIRQYSGSTLTFGGGGTFVGPVDFLPMENVSRAVVIEGSPMINTAPGDRSRAFRFHALTELNLKSQNNRMYIELGASSSGAGSSLHCRTNDVLDYQCDIILGYGSTMDIHGFDQQVGDLQTGSSGRICSDEPATLLAFYDMPEGIVWGVQSGIDGAVAFKKSGPRLLTINGTNTTTGALIALNGPLSIGETGSWQGTNVCIGAESSNRHPSLRLSHSKCFANGRKTVLTMTTSTAEYFNTDCGASRTPELILDEGVNVCFREVLIDGCRLAAGTWGGPNSPAKNKDSNHFSGTGMITVMGSGFVLVIK